MSKISFFLTDIIHKKNSSNQLTVLGRDLSKKRVVLEAEFDPYFWAKVSSKKDLAKSKIEKIAEVKSVEFEKKSLDGKTEDLAKIKAVSPESIPEIKKEVSNLAEVSDIREYDIPFERRFLIDNQLKQFHLCSAEVSNGKIKSISCSDEKMHPKILAFDIEVEFEKRFPDAKKDRVICISFYGSNEFKKVIIWKKFATQKKFIQFAKSEKELLELTMKEISDFDPDILVGYNSDGFDIPYLKDRCSENNLEFSLGWFEHEKRFPGISKMDVLSSVRKIFSQNLRTNRYDLNSVSSEMLGLKKTEGWNPNKINEVIKSGKDSELELLAEYNLNDSYLAFLLLEKTLQALSELNNLTLSLIEESSKMNYGMLVEWFLISEFFKAGKIVSNRPSFKESASREKRRIQGAYVFQPNAGLYENLHVLDFRSLYPSIVCAHNISPEKTNFIPNLIRKIILERKKLKHEYRKTRSEETNARQFSLKILANSFYGYLGFPQSRWYSFDSAQEITAYGRKYIQDVIETAKKKGFDVIYGDTDSVFIRCESKQKILDFVEFINSKLPSDIELEYDNFYPSGIFLSRKNETGGAKKRYALMDEKKALVIKGLEAIRGDWSNLAKKVQYEVMRLILSEKKPDSALKHVDSIIKNVCERKINMSDLIIRTRLLKPISMYKSRGPHVAAAQIYASKGFKVGKGFMVEYVVCSGNQKNISDRIKLGDEASINDYDPAYYIEHQIIRAVFKIFELFGIKLEKSSKKQSKLGTFI